MAMPSRNDLPDDPEVLKDRVLYLETKVAKLEAEQRLTRAERFGASSEHNAHQGRLFDEAEQGVEPHVEDAQVIEVAAHVKRRPKRKPLPADLPRHVIEHPPARTHCECGGELERIGTKTSEQLDVIPAQVFVIEHRRGTYKCPRCEDAEPETTPLPAQPIEKSMASPGLLAHVGVSKYADGLPLYRQSAMFERLGIDLSRQTMAGHMVAAGALIEPLIERLGHRLREYDIVAMDETRVQVLKEPNRPAKTQSWMWVMRGGPPRARIIVFHYDQSRSSSVPISLLGDYEGYLQTDGYGAYRAITSRPEITGLGCWAHARRGFFKARQVMPKGKVGRPDQALAYISRLYGLERQWQKLSGVQRTERRQAEAKPILEDLHAWLTKQDINPEGLLGKAVAYTRKEWPRLLVYLEDGRLSIDNNAVENAIRPFAVGRKAWLFSNTPRGATASANLYTLVESAKANSVNPYAYLKCVFSKLPNASTDADLDALMPWAIEPVELDALLVPPIFQKP
jgi:transposase